MHRELIIENFKCFSDKTKIKLGKITVCLGSNSVGKSSVMQACILLRQIYEQAALFKDTKVKEYNIRLNDVYGLQLGDAEHIKSSKSREDICLKIDEYEYSLISDNRSPMEMIVQNKYDIEKMSSAGGLFSKGFYYLNAERTGPRNYQTINSKMVNNCGVYGENTVHLLSVLGNDKVDELKCYALEEGKRVNTFSDMLEKHKSYQEVSQQFTIDTGIDCSPQAGREKVQALRETQINEITGQEETVVCELHTKFKTFNTDRTKQDRIYFFPGKQGILEGRIIVKHIGTHL